MSDRRRPEAEQRQGRLLAIDAIRGLAMVLAILQHAYLNRNPALIPPLFDMVLWGITYLAAVAFVGVSGSMYSYALYCQPSLQVVYRKYAARALFMLLAVHPAINLANALFRLPTSELSDWNVGLLVRILLDFPVTDTIGICFLLAPPFIVALKPGKRTVAIVAMLTGSLLVRAGAFTASSEKSLLSEVLFGSAGLPRMFWFPVVPWLAIFLTGSFVGKDYAYLKSNKLKLSEFLERLNRAALILAIVSVVLTSGYKYLKLTHGALWSPQLFIAIYPAQTTTLLPGYLAVLAWLLFILTKRIDIRGRCDLPVWLLSILGRTSLFTYVVQFIVVESVPALFGFKGVLGVGGFLLLFVVSLVVMLGLSYSYGRLRGWFSTGEFAATACRVHAPRTGL